MPDTNRYNLKNILAKSSKKDKPTTIEDLKQEVKQLQEKIRELKNRSQNYEYRLQILENQSKVGPSKPDNREGYVDTVTRLVSQKWYTTITLVINSTYKKDFAALIDSGADLNSLIG